jgi:hypothetical protein
MWLLGVLCMTDSLALSMAEAPSVAPQANAARRTDWWPEPSGYGDKRAVKYRGSGGWSSPL